MERKNKVSRDPVRAETTRKTGGARTAIRAPKAPTDEQYVKMAGAMANALERLRIFYTTLDRARQVTAAGGTGVPEVYRDNGAILLHPSEAAALLNEVVEAANILRVGLKARVR